MNAIPSVSHRSLFHLIVKWKIIYSQEVSFLKTPRHFHDLAGKRLLEQRL